MKKFIVETYYTCVFKTVHTLDNLNDNELSKVDSRNDGEVVVIDVKLNNRKTKKIGNKKELSIWGSGNAKRELMFVNDFADAVIFFMNKKIKQPFLNIGTGKDYSIKWYAKFLMKKFRLNLKIKFDKSKPDGMPKKCLDISLAKKYGWKPNHHFDRAFEITYKDFLKNKKNLK